MNIVADTAATYKLIAVELEQRGYQVANEVEDNRLTVTYTSPSGKQWKTSAAHIHYPFTSVAAKELSINKSRAYQFVQDAGLSVPFTLHIGAEEPLSPTKLSSIVQLHAPLIVKPNDASLSKGLTMHITDAEHLKAAIEVARAVKQSDVLVQQQVSGEEIRFVVIKGKVVAALLRQTPRVVGDGVRTVRALVDEENKAREVLHFPYVTYPYLTGDIVDPVLLESNYTPENGEVFELSRATMIKNGCSVYQVLESIHPSYIKQVETLAGDVDAAFFVADFLIQDYTAPLTPNTSWFLEFNVSPVLKLFYGCRDGNMFDVVPRIADLIEEVLV